MERFAVIGLGRFGIRLARLLAHSGAEVVAIDADRDLIEQVRDDVDRAVCLDATDETALLAQGVDKVDAAIVGIGTDFEAAVLTTVVLKQIGVGRVISRATTSVRGQILSRIGADGIVNPERESAERWCGKLLAPSIMESTALADDYSLAQVAAPESFRGRSLGELDVRKRFNVNVIAIRRTVEEVGMDGQKKQQEQVDSAPMAESVIKEGDVLLLIGHNEKIAAFPTK